MADPRLSSILDRSGDPSTVAWAHEGAGDLAALADPLLAIQAALELGNGAALQAASTSNLPKDVRKAAGAALHRLKSRGVKVAPIAPKVVVLPAEALDLPPRAFVSVPDADGDLEVALTASTGEGSCVCAALLGGSSGISDIRHGHCNRSELRRVWREMETRRDLVEVPFLVGLHILDGLASGHDWNHFLTHVSAPTLQAARLLDPTQGVPSAVVEDEALVGRDWSVPVSLLDASIVAQAAEKVAHAGSNSQDFAAHLDAAVLAISETGYTKNRAALLRHLELVALAFRWHGRAASADAALAQKAAIEAGEALSSIPSVRNAAGTAVTRQLAEMAREIQDTLAQLGLSNDQAGHDHAWHDHAGHDHDHAGHDHDHRHG